VKEAHQLMKGDVFLSDKTYWVVKEIDTDTQIEITPGLFIDDVGFTEGLRFRHLHFIILLERWVLPETAITPPR
jgi:hypothetical protein